MQQTLASLHAGYSIWMTAMEVRTRAPHIELCWGLFVCTCSCRNDTSMNTSASSSSFSSSSSSHFSFTITSCFGPFPFSYSSSSLRHHYAELVEQNTSLLKWCWTLLTGSVLTSCISMNWIQPQWKKIEIALKFPPHTIDVVDSEADPVVHLLSKWPRGANQEHDTWPLTWRTLMIALQPANIQDEANILE